MPKFANIFFTTLCQYVTTYLSIPVLVYSDASRALLVYQLMSVDLSPAMYQISSTISARVSRAEGMFGGRAFTAIAWERGEGERD